MLIMSATAHLLAVRPAALVGFPIMIIGSTCLILVLLYVVGPEQQAEAQGPSAVVEYAIVPAVAIDPQTGRILASNEGADDLIGEALLAPGTHLSQVLAEGSKEQCRTIVRNTLECGEFEFQACPVRTSNGAVIAQLSARLHERGGESFVVIGIANNDLNEAVARFARVQERLMSNISHELRTPLNVVMGFSELLATETLGELADSQLDAAEECHEGGERMLRLINDILDVGRSRSYYLDGDTRPLSPVEMIHRVENLLSGQARREDLRLEVDLDESLPVIETEERAFKQLIYHLVVNSMNRSTSGEAVRISAGRDDDHLVLSVSDSGGAVTEEMQPQPVPTVSDQEATERLAPPLLGLPLCATLAEKLGASLSADGDEDGTHFTIRMPLLRS
jgi:signal transduction histidine kinase